MTIVLETPRLLMRPHNDSDLNFMIELNSDPEVIRYTGDSAFASPAEVATLVGILSSQFTKTRTGRFVVLSK